MFLEKIEILGFKSFVHKTTLKFFPGIICIVGPNGSGKSNISDAVRWVLGEQSLKALRGKKSEDIIFAGSIQLARVGFAQVSLYLNNEDRKAPIDYSEIVITRRLYRNGESEYLINKSRVRLQDILLLLAKSNFGQKSYSIISQGTIDSILLASPQERREFFNEAAGVKQYQIKREQTLLKLEATKENLKKVEIMMQEIEPHLKSLTRQVKRLEKREEVERILKESQKKYYYHLWRNIDGNYEQRRQDLNKSEQNYQRVEKELAEIQEKMKNLSSLKIENKEVVMLEEDYQKILEAKNNFLKQQAILEGRMEIEKERTKENISLPVFLPQEMQEISQKLEEIEKSHHNLIMNLDRVERLEELEEIKQEINLISREISRLILRMKKSKIKDGRSEEKISLIESELKKMLELIEEKEEKLILIAEKIKKYKNAEQGEMQKLFDLQKNFQDKQNEFNKANFLNNETRVESTKIETRREDLKNEILEELKSFEELENQILEDNFDAYSFLSEIHRLKSSLEVIGGIDPEVNKEYQEIKERFDFLFFQTNDLKNATKNLEKVIKELDAMIKKQFNTSFNLINQGFEKYFKILFDGGAAKLVLQKSEIEQIPAVNEDGGFLINPDFNENKGYSYTGIDIQATPPGKRLKNINLLSGGERALTSLALICAIISCNPSPFVILDEVDAALDEINSTKFSDILTGLAHQSQFIVITHNRATMEKAKILYGVTMGENGVSRLLSLKLEDIKEVVS
ncbi:MAG: Uncharacterized protein Athens101410_93 [Parcubacteria group bacterium Athens1014_10]|nr:MAG: Uncharacterized protein Athens101410_93 [Parcubacteria group bacterium Athens1014_10]TSD05937.1 MAG: Uncharacterized protein Athens071412_219 [Parcubacteria group bacterium Athens0714_12]